MDALSEKIKKLLLNEVYYSVSRSPGPGGQHVNKTNTKVELRFNVWHSYALNQHQKDIILNMLKNKINKEGELILVCHESRSQSRNRDIVLFQFFNLINQVLKPKKKRKPTTPTPGSINKRLISKKHLAEIKKNRKKIRF